MKALITTAALVVGSLLIYGSPATAQEHWHPLSYAQRKAYDSCVTSAWVADFCRGHSWGLFASNDLTYAGCVFADTHRRRVVASPYANIEEYCWRRVRGRLR